MSAVVDPRVHAQALASTAAHLLNLVDRATTLAVGVLHAHRRGDAASAQMLRGQRDELDAVLLLAHQRADIKYGRRQMADALTVERRRRRAQARKDAAA